MPDRTIMDSLTIPHRDSMPWLLGSIIYMVRSGSHAYGTNIATSDTDYKGVAIAPQEYYLGFVKRFEQAECRVPYDAVTYELRKFMNLAADCNPSIIEVLFTDFSDVIYMHRLGAALRENRNLFLSKKARYTFTGYAMSQLKRIQRHYGWLKHPPKKLPERADFNLPERTLIPADQRAAVQSAVVKKLQEWDVDLEPVDNATRLMLKSRFEKVLTDILITEDNLWKHAARNIGVDDNFIHLMELERAYSNAKNEWDNYQHWKAERNPARAELEAKWGYDTKHGMHLVRLMRMGWEILTYGNVWVKRPDAEELLAIRQGAWPYEQMVQYANDMEDKINAAYDTSPLPKAPDRNALDKLCVKLVQEKHLLDTKGFYEVR